MSESFLSAPVATSVRLIDFDDVKIVPGFVPKTWILIVSGTKPYLNMHVELSPLIYITRPDYWGIEVIGRLYGIGLPALAPYSVSIPLDGITGKKGIEVIGAKKKQKFAVPPKAKKSVKRK